MNFGQEVKVAGSGLIWANKKVELFFGNEII